MLCRFAVYLVCAGVSLSHAARAETAPPVASQPCPRPAEGSRVVAPPSLFSDNGKLDVTLNYETGTDAASHTLFCFVTPSGDQSPTLHVKRGDTITMTVNNHVPALPGGAPTEIVSDASQVCGSATMTDTSVNVHFHGLNVSPACHGDQVIHTLINSGESFQYQIVIPDDEPPGLYWYHPHVHGIAEQSVQGGATGAIIVEGIDWFQPSVLNLPERVLVFRDQVLDVNQPPVDDVPSWDTSINYVPIKYPNLQPASIVSTNKGQEFWRVANTAADSIYDLQLLFDGVPQQLQVVGLDGVPLGSQDGTGIGKTVSVTHVLIPTGGRAEFIVPTPPPGTRQAQLVTKNADTGPDGDNDPKRVLATIEPRAVAPSLADAVTAAAATPGSWQPERFAGLDKQAVTAHRDLYFSEVLSDPTNPASQTNFYITVNGAKPTLFDPNNDPAITTHVGAVETWTISNQTSEVHEFHIHQVHFKVLKQNNAAVPEKDQQYRDVVDVPYWSGKGSYPSVTIQLDFRGAIAGDLVYHCHILGHEDNGMMAVIRVLPAE